MSDFPITEFFNEDSLTVSATLDTAAEGESSINIHFLNEFEIAQAEEIPFEATNPLAYCKSSDVSAAVQDDTLTVNGTAYKIKSLEPDATGITILMLYE